MTAHTDVGAYSMGLLEERDRREFEDHLAGCPACAAEVAELSPMAALLKGVEPREAEPAAAVTASPAVAHVTARRRRLLVIRMNAPLFRWPRPTARPVSGRGTQRGAGRVQCRLD